MENTITNEEKKISVLNAIVEIIASQDNIIEIFREIKNYLKSIIPCDYLTVLFNNEKARYFYTVPALNISKHNFNGEITIPYHETSITEILRAKSIIKRDDLNSRGNMTPGDLKFLQPGISSDISVPVITDNRVRVILNFSSYQAAAFSDCHQVIIEEVALILSISMKRIDLLAEVRGLKKNVSQWRNRYNTLLNNTSIPTIILNSDLAIIYEANKAFESLSGYTAQQLHGMRFSSLHPKIQSHILHQHMKDSISGKTPEVNSIQLTRSNGEELRVSLRFFSARETDEPRLFVAYKEQETKYKFQAQESASLNQIVSLLQIGNELLGTNNLDLLTISILDELGLRLNAKYITLHLLDEEDKNLKMFCARKFPFDNGMSIVHPWLLGLNEGPYKAVIENNRITKFTNIYEEENSFKWLPIAQKLGYSSLISIPLSNSKKIIGTLTLFYEKATRFAQEDIVNLKSISNYLALLIDNHRIHQKLQLSDTQYGAIQNIIESSSSGRSIKEIIEGTVLHLNNILDFDYLFITLFDSIDENYQIYAIASETYKNLTNSQSWIPINDTNLGWIYIPKPGSRPNGELSKFDDWLKKLKSKLDSLLLVRGKYSGAITIASFEQNKYNARDEKLLNAVSKQVAFAFENTRLQEENRTRSENLGTLTDLYDELDRAEDADMLLSNLLNFLIRVTGGSFASFRFVEENNPVDNFICTRPDATEKRLLVKEQNEFIPYIVKSLQPLYFEEFSRYSETVFSKQHFPEGYNAYYGFPVVRHSRIYGVCSIYWEKSHKLSLSETNLLTTIEKQSGIYLENLRLLNDKRKNNNVLKTTNQELENFVYTVSHDLKSPIVSIQGFTSILMNECQSLLNEESYHYLKRIQSNANQMELLIKDLLELSRIGRVVSPFEETNIKDIITQTMGELVYQIEKRGIKIIRQEDYPIVVGDKKRIAQVFTNLIENSVKYIGRSNPNPQIEIGYKNEAETHLFYIKDNGIGIPKKFQQHIFGLFKGFNQDETDEYSSGVGLAIVKRIIENHNGKVWFQSEEKKGSTFYFTIPKSLATNSAKS